MKQIKAKSNNCGALFSRMANESIQWDPARKNYFFVSNFYRLLFRF